MTDNTNTSSSPPTTSSPVLSSSRLLQTSSLTTAAAGGGGSTTTSRPTSSSFFRRYYSSSSSSLSPTSSSPPPRPQQQLRHVTSSALMMDDQIQRAGSVNPAVLNVTDLYQCRFPSSTALALQDQEVTAATTAVAADNVVDSSNANTDNNNTINNDNNNDNDYQIDNQQQQQLLLYRHPKILVLFCGGTLIMKEGYDGSLVVNDKDIAIELLLGLEPRLMDEIAHMDVEHIDNIDSSNMTPTIWDKLGTVLYQNYNNYDGFVITHGTDTMAYTSSALSFILSDIGKPVVLTGAQVPGSRIETDARRNFVNAVRVATLDRAGVFLVFDGDIILGSRAHKLSESKLDAFGPINWGLLGEIRIDIRFNDDDAKSRHDNPDINFQPGFDNNVVVYTLFPGFATNELMATIDRGTVRGIVLICYGSGNISYEYMNCIKRATSKGIAVIVTTQCLEGATLMHLYDVGRQALANGAIQAYDMSKECIITKLMWALHRSTTLEDVQRILHTNYTGEINMEGKLYGART